MTRAQAIAKLRKVLGPQAYWTVSERVSSPDMRDRYRTRRAAARAAEKVAADALAARRAAVLAADVEYQTLIAVWREAKAADEEIRYRDGESGYKFEVGTIVAGMFRTVKAQGDTWEEVFEKLVK